MMTMQEIREKTSEELRRTLRELAGRLREHRFGVAIQQERNIAARSAMRRTIARIKTELTARARNSQ